MNILPSNEKIEKYLDELADEYKSLLFNALVSRSKNLDDLSVSELLRLDNEIKKPLFENYKKQQRRRKMFQVAGLTYMLLGFMMFLTDLGFTNELDIISLMSLIISFIGVFITIFSFMLPTLHQSSTQYNNKSEKKSLPLLEYKVITKWRELEGIVNDISINSNVKKSRYVTEFLFENKFIDNDEYIKLKYFLKMRNNIVHSSADQYSIEEINVIIDEVDKIIDKIKKIV
ncbi:DUF2207 domain-containing protein [Longibaculum muris]|uniref:hypothetical protein n=1 Tax=Longibaculum muris TaxID=1796628 RepID=UPI0022E5D573|nr:hypothetical protein [Longibaculum muris]